MFLPHAQCHRYDFLVRLWNVLNFFELFKLLFSLGIDHDPPCFLCSHDLCLFIFTMFILHDHMAKRSHYHIMIFLTSEYLLYRRIPTLILVIVMTFWYDLSERT